MKKFFGEFHGLRDFLLLWSTQALSTLGSSMTSFALILWSYQSEGSALTTALLSVCSYAPYVVMSIFAGALSDRWNKKATLLVCDTLAALSTLTVLFLFLTGRLTMGWLYVLNALSGLMNTIQVPAAEVVNTLLVKREQFQRTSSLRSMSGALNSILSPALATALMVGVGLQGVILVDLATFLLAAVTLLFFVRIPEAKAKQDVREPLLAAAKAGLVFLRQHRGIFDLILFLGGINLTASMYNAALPPYVISVAGDAALGVLNSVCGVTLLLGSLLASLLPPPKSRVKVIMGTLLLSMSTENLVLAVTHTLPWWCFGAFLGWIGIPLMNANMDVILRTSIPIELQGRVWSVRNTFQFFTIPIGYFAGGWLVDDVFEPWMATQAADSLAVRIFGAGKGSGAAAVFLLLTVLGVVTCLLFRRDRRIRALETTDHAAA